MNRMLRHIAREIARSYMGKPVRTGVPEGPRARGPEGRSP